MSDVSIVSTPIVIVTPVDPAVVNVTALQRGPKGDPGPPGSYYEHVQSQASTVWEIVHNLNCYPDVAFIDTTQRRFYGPFVYQDTNTIIATFNAAEAGIAHCK